MQLRISYKEAAQSGDNAFRLRQSYATEFAPPESLTLPLDALDMDSLYASVVRAIAGDALSAPEQPFGAGRCTGAGKRKVPAAAHAAEGKDEEGKEFGKADGIKERNTKIGRGTINDKC